MERHLVLTRPRAAHLPLALGLAHGVSDGAAGLLLGSLAHSLPLAQVALMVLLYNGLAFGGQPLAGLLTDRLRRPRAVALVCLLVMVVGLMLAGEPWLAVTLAGIGSAAYHVGGGALALCATREASRGPGLFAAPGVLGLAIGGALAVAGYTAAWPFIVLLLLWAAALAAWPMPRLPYDPAEAAGEPVIDSHDLIMIALLAAIALRSAVWATYQYLLDGNLPALLAVAVAAAVGKAAGGYLADWAGWRRWTVGALLAAAPLLALGGQNVAVMALGVALMQSATPAAVMLTARLLPRQPATAAGLVFGLAVAVGGLPLLAGGAAFLASPLGATAAIVAAALVFWLATRGLRTRRANGLAVASGALARSSPGVHGGPPAT